MTKHFYSKFVETSSISLELGDMNLSKEERKELISLIESNIHHSVLDTVLSELEEEDKKVFLKNLHEQDHRKTWNHLKEKIEDTENKIKNLIKSLVKEFFKDIQDAKRLK